MAIDPTLFELISNVTSKVFEPCQIPECEKHSTGMICHTCNRYVCLKHAYLTPTIPPAFICASCVIDRHDELFEQDEHDDRRPPPRVDEEERRRQARANTSSPPPPRRDNDDDDEYDDDVLDAEVVG